MRLASPGPTTRRRPVSTRQRAISTRCKFASALATNGRLMEAEVEARQALLSQLHIRGRYASETMTAVVTLGRVIGMQGRYAEAEKLLGTAVSTYQTLGFATNSSVLLDARGVLASNLLAENNAKAAMDQYRAIEQAAGNDARLRVQYLDEQSRLCDRPDCDGAWRQCGGFGANRGCRRERRFRGRRATLPPRQPASTLRHSPHPARAWRAMLLRRRSLYCSRQRVMTIPRKTMLPPAIRSCGCNSSSNPISISWRAIAAAPGPARRSALPMQRAANRCSVRLPPRQRALM